MLHRIWKPVTLSTTESRSTITFYDAGSYWGQLINDDVWICYRVIKRERVGEEIHEDLERMSDDYIPWEIASTETYVLNNFQKDTGVITIPGWEIKFV
jgi:hypothetical protein